MVRMEIDVIYNEDCLEMRRLPDDLHRLGDDCHSGEDAGEALCRLRDK